MSQPINLTESLPGGVAGRINPVCDRFEKAWQTGGRPRLEEFLPDGEAADQPWLLRDLLRLEVFYRGRSGETPTAEEYRHRLPDHAALIEKVFAALPTADPHATRYSDTPAVADPHATRYSDPPAAEAPSSRLPRRFGGYELLEEIGHGGMGVVYKARQFSPERLVALKLIRAGQLADEEDVRRFRQEANEAARLDHPNIVPVYEVGEQDGLHFFTMKLVEGGGLDKHLERYRNDPKAAARLLATAARAVHYAHQRQLLHRDLKPGNILLDAAGQPHVADFGLAKRMEGDVAAMTQSNAIVGTPEYMAPEQAGGEKRLTTAVDVYALGGVLYTLLAGRPPFQAKTPLDVLMKVVSEAPAPPSKVRPGEPRDLETICLKCLAKEPAKRYGSAEALAEDLERWLKGEAVRARPPSLGYVLCKWVRRNRRPLTVAAGMLLLLTAVVVGAFVQVMGARDEAVHKGNDLEIALHAKQEALNGRQVALNANQQTLDSLNEQLSILARSYADRSDVEYNRGNIRDSLNWMLRAYAVAPGKDPLRPSYQRLALCRARPISLRPFLRRDLDVPDFPLWYDGPVSRITFRPDSHALVTASGDGTARLWDAASGKELQRLKHNGPVRAASFSPDANRVVTASEDGTARLWDAASGKELQRFTHGDEVDAASFSPDGRTVVTSSKDGTARLWDAASGKELQRFTHGDEVDAASFSPDGHLVISTGWDFAARLWESAGGKNMQPLKHEGRVTMASFSPNGRTIVTASYDGTVGLWDAVSGKRLQRLPHDKGVNTAEFSPDGRTIVSASDDKTARLWDVASGKELQQLKHVGKVHAASFSPDGRTIITASEDGIARLWDAASGKELVKLQPNPVTTFAFAGAPTVLPGDSHYSAVLRALFSPDGRMAVTVSEDGTARLCDVDNLSGPDEVDQTRLRAWVLMRTGQDFTPEGTLHPLSLDEWQQQQTLDAKEEDWLTHIDPQQWHLAQAAKAEADNDWFAARFHLNCLLTRDPNNLEILRRRDEAAAHLPKP